MVGISAVSSGSSSYHDTQKNAATLPYKLKETSFVSDMVINIIRRFQ